MQYNFDCAVAQRYGVDEAIFIHRLWWWIAENKAKNVNERGGLFWTYDTQQTLSEIFPFWSRRQVQRIVKSCVDQGAVLTSDYNTKRTCRMVWYTITAEIFNFYEQSTVACNAMHQTVPSNAPNGATHGTKRCNVYNEHLEDQLEDQLEREETAPPPPPLPKEPSKMAYGEFGNVLLSQVEVGKLVTRFGEDAVRNQIEALSQWLRNNPKKAKGRDCYATLLQWFRRDAVPELGAQTVIERRNIPNVYD